VAETAAEATAAAETAVEVTVEEVMVMAETTTILIITNDNQIHMNICLI
jgi:hypothetical protein